MFQSFVRNWVRFLSRFYWIILILCVVGTAFSIPRVIHLFKNISTDPIDLLPQDHISVKNLLALRDKMKPKRAFIVLFETENPEAIRRLLADLKPVLEQSSWVSRAMIQKPGYGFFDENKFLFLNLDELQELKTKIDRRIQKEKLGSLYVSLEEDNDQAVDLQSLENQYRLEYGISGDNGAYYASPNGKMYSIFIESKKSNLSLNEERSFQAEIRHIMADFPVKQYDSNVKVSFAGTTRIMEYEALMRDLKLAGMISLFLIFTPLLIRFRRPTYIALIFLPLAAGIPLGLAASTLFVSKLNVTTSFLFAILGGLGVESGIHLFSRFYEKRREGKSLEESLIDLFQNQFSPIFTAVASLVLTFLLMMFSDFRGFSEFGLISGIGLTVIFILYFTFFPALLIFTSRIRLLKIGSEMKEFESKFAFSPAWVRSLLWTFGLFTLFSIAVMPRVGFEYDSKKIRADTPESRETKQKQKLTTGYRINSPAVVLIENEEQYRAIEKAIQEKIKANPNTLLYRVSSLYSLVPDQQNEKLEEIKQIEALLDDDTIKLVKGDKREKLQRFLQELKRSHKVLADQVPQELKDMFLGDTTKPGNLLMIFAKPKVELDNGKNAIQFADELRSIETPAGIFYPTSDAIMYADVLKTMFRDSKKVLITSILSIMFFVWLEFRQWRKTLIVMLSILIGLVWVFGVMWLLRFKLNLYNMVMIPAIMGMSIDNSIHLYHRYEELGKGSLSKVLSTTGVSALLASCTNASGFIGMVFCVHGGLRSMGNMALIGLATCLISTLLFFPVFLDYLEKRKKNSPI